MRRAASAEDFLTDPVGRYLTGRAFVAWMPDASLVGASHFGAFEPADEPALQALMNLPLHRALAVPHDVVHDLGAIDVLDRPAFDGLAGFLAAQMPRLAGRVRRLAVVRPGGLAGAAFTGLFHDFGAKLDGRLFDERAAALAWLEVAPDQQRELAGILAGFERAAPLLRRLRDAISADPRGITLARAAAALGESARSLQRHLAGERTSFRDELAHVRLQVAKARLVETDDKIEAIAHDLGFRSIAAFTTMFGRALGEPPREFRRRRRPAP